MTEKKNCKLQLLINMLEITKGLDYFLLLKNLDVEYNINPSSECFLFSYFGITWVSKADGRKLSATPSRVGWFTRHHIRHRLHSFGSVCSNYECGFNCLSCFSLHRLPICLQLNQCAFDRYIYMHSI